jgi:hypothetical protein
MRAYFNHKVSEYYSSDFSQSKERFHIISCTAIDNPWIQVIIFYYVQWHTWQNFIIECRAKVVNLANIADGDDGGDILIQKAAPGQYYYVIKWIFPPKPAQKPWQPPRYEPRSDIQCVKTEKDAMHFCCDFNLASLFRLHPDQPISPSKIIHGIKVIHLVYSRHYMKNFQLRAICQMPFDW